MNRMKAFVDGGMPFDIKKFKNVPIELAPIYGWNFNDKLDKDIIKKQIDDMSRAGIRAFYVIPEPKEFRPNSMPTALEPDYLSDEYMEYFEFASEYAKEKGMLMWLYDEGGWPSGGACGKVYKRDSSTAKNHIAEEARKIKKGDRYTIPKDAVSAFMNGERIRSDFTAKSDTEVFEYKIVDDHAPYTQVGNRNTPYQEVLATDGMTSILEPRTAELFIETTHEQYRKFFGDDFGSHMTMMFTDEPQPGRPAWFSGIEKDFSARYGYDILDHLPSIFRENGDEQFRIDYHDLCGERLRKVFFEPIRKWCNDHDLLFCGHLDLDSQTDGAGPLYYGSALDLLRTMDVPGVDVIWRQIYPRACSENTDGVCPFFPRMASSAAVQGGGNLSLTESLGVYGLGVTMDEMRYTFNYQAIRGVSLMNPLLITYGTRDHFGFGERPYFNGEIPGHDDLPLINDCYARVSYLVTAGRRNVSTALHLSTDDINAGGERCKRFVGSFEKAGSLLEDSGIDFDIIDPKGILEGRLEDGKLHIGAAAYDSIIIPEGTEPRAEIKNIIASLKGAPTPLVSSDIGFAELRVSSRSFDSGDMLYLFFNESAEKITASVEINDIRPAYMLNTVTGKAYIASSKVDTGKSLIDISIESGDIIGILFTDLRIDISEPVSYTHCHELRDFEIRAARRFTIDESGFYDTRLDEEFRPARLGSWTEFLGEGFSGEAEYRTHIKLDKIEGATAKLSLGKLCYSASVYVNGSFAGIAGLTPAEVEFPSKLLKVGVNSIMIKAANTGANEMLFSDAEEAWTAAELSPYNDRARRFEEDSLESGLFGPVYLLIGEQ